MDLTVGRIVWARRDKEDIYWPGKIINISDNTNNLWSLESLYDFQQQCNYFVEFFITNQSAWITDILPYRQYRDSMTNDSFMNYGLHSTIKPDFLNAIHQADYASNNEIYTNSKDLTTMTAQQQDLLPTIEDNTDNDFLLTSSPMFTSNTGYYNSSYQQTSALSLNFPTELSDVYPSNNNQNTQSLTTNNDWYAQQGLLVESITPPLPSQNDNQSDDFQTINPTIMIITTKTYSNSSFISYLFNSLSNFFPSSIIYLDHLTNYQHPTTSNIYYLICLDHFDSPIKQILDSTILNNLNAHINYLFLVMNTPSHEFVRHIYSTVMDKRSILVLHYHLTFDNDPILLCSGNRTTFEMIRSSFLKYLCSKMKYIESNEDEEQQLYSAYCISSIIQSTNVLNHFVNEQIQQTLNEKFEFDFLGNNKHVINELFPQLSINKSSNSNNLLELVHNSNADILKDPLKQSTIMNDLFQSGAIKTNIPPPICEYYTQKILHEK